MLIIGFVSDCFTDLDDIELKKNETSHLLNTSFETLNLICFSYVLNRLINIHVCLQ